MSFLAGGTLCVLRLIGIGIVSYYFYFSQNYIREGNREFEADIINVTPDADAEIDVELIKKFNIPLCPDCGSDLLKPQVSTFI